MATVDTETDFGSLLKTARRRKPPGTPTLIVVTDHFHKFHGSSLWKTSVRTQAFKAIDLDAATDAQLDGAAFLRWAPWSVTEIAPEQRARIPAGARIVNDTDFSCSKKNVMAVFERLFGRQIRLDPYRHTGPAVEKSDHNGWHDGRIVQLPITSDAYEARPPLDDLEKLAIPASQRDPDYIYQRVVDNTIGRWAYDIRVPYFCGSVPFAYVKVRPVGTRFVNRNTFVKLVAPYEILSRHEIAQCKAFFREINLEYGEIDVLRDSVSGETYIVDANNTPAGPPRGMSPEERTMAFRLLATAVLDHVF